MANAISVSRGSGICKGPETLSVCLKNIRNITSENIVSLTMYSNHRNVNT